MRWSVSASELVSSAFVRAFDEVRDATHDGGSTDESAIATFSDVVFAVLDRSEHQRKFEAFFIAMQIAAAEEQNTDK